MEKLFRIFHAIVRWLSSRKGLATTGSLGFLLTLITITFFLLPHFTITDPGLFANDEFQALRQDVLNRGSVPKEASTMSALRAGSLLSISDPTGEVTLTMSDEKQASDYFEFVHMAPWTFHDTKYQIRTFLCTQLFCFLDAENAPFYIEVSVYDANGDPIIDPDLEVPSSIHAYYSLKEDGTLSFVSATDRRHVFSPEDWTLCQEAMNARVKKVVAERAAMPQKFGYYDGTAFFAESAALFRRVDTIISLARVTMYSSVLAVASFSLCFGCLIMNAAKEKKRHPDLALLVASQSEAETSKEPETTPPPEGKIEAWLIRHHIRPVFGEWFFRGIGLFLVFSCSLVLTLFTQAFIYEWGENWLIVSDNTSEIFNSISSVGTFILLVAVISIISETRRNLHASAWAFITLTIGYYFFSCASLFAKEVGDGRFGTQMANNVAMELPGNIFLGMGLFAITGFFLFFNPPENLIHRKAFRALSLIPTLVALTSVVFTYLFKAEVYTPSYWIRNILFIRDSNIVFMGIFYEYALFFFRRIMAKRYGEDGVDDALLRPYVQFQKNLALIGVIVLFTVAFYLIPSEQRAFFGFRSTHAYYFVTIPFFLFYRPTGKYHKSKNDVLYYALYAVAWAVPSIPGFIESISAFIQ